MVASVTVCISVADVCLWHKADIAIERCDFANDPKRTLEGAPVARGSGEIVVSGLEGNNGRGRDVISAD
jgi:hypothetical protein